MADDDEFNLDTNLENPIPLVNMITSIHKKGPYDETILVGDEEEVESYPGDSPKVPKSTELGLRSFEATLEEMLEGRCISTQRMLMSRDELDNGKSEFSEEALEYDDDEEEDDEGVDEARKLIYHPEDYDKLPVSSEVKELFRYITGFTPKDIELDLYLKPFIPDYIPATGDVDIMVKIPRPDKKPDFLGMTVVDEPIAKLTDPAVLKLALRMERKHASDQAQDEVVKSIAHDPKEIDHWITSLNALHRTNAPPKVHYTRNMPSVDALMQEWGPEIEELLSEVSLPTAELDCGLPAFVDIICSLLNIPIYKSRIQSLHLFFSLYLEFKNSQHFGEKDVPTKPSAEDHLIL